MADLRSGDRSPAVGDIVKDIQNDVRALVQNEIALAKAELVPAAKNAGVGAGGFAGAGYFALNALTLLYIAGSLAIWKWLDVPIAVGFVIMAGVLLVIAAILAVVGLASVKKVKGPERTIAQAKTSVDSVKGAIKNGTAAAKTPLIEGSVVEQQSIGGSGNSPVRRDG